jgi:PAS domain S-box-containing protein
MSAPDGRITYLNRPWQEFTGRSLDKDLGEGWAEGIHPDDVKRVQEVYAVALKAHSGFRLEMRMRRFDGAYRWILNTGLPRISPQGEFQGFIGSGIDIHDLKDTEEQLRQAQKMEAVGRLAGGIAHDFNNLLTAINGYSEMALGMIDDDDPLFEYLTEIRKSGERAAGLTQQLLAYSRKQILAPKVFDLNDTVVEMEKMLRRVIGEDIELSSELEPELGLAKADPGQIQQIILNLVLNARDAMPNGGRLVLQTANVVLNGEQVNLPSEPARGPHVRLSVSDNGIGMTPEVRSRIFEPFFTTKGVGKGTGLGLSSVYGIIKQSGGSISVTSEYGRGSTFHVYLPISESEKERIRYRRYDAPEPQAKGETILLVEDEETVRKFIHRTLSARGYAILEAGNGAEALSVAAKSGPIDLVLTDVVMPNMNGGQLAEKLKALQPNINILFMSGYTSNIFLSKGFLDPGARFLQKPFSQGELIRKVEEVLQTAPK